MKILKFEDYKNVKRLVDEGDEEAKNFLMSYFEMDDKKANDYLVKIAKENKEKDINDVVDDLIKDEYEAIDGYDKAIKLAQSQEKDDLIALFTRIKMDELRHIEELQGSK